jgi:hypothetical protein
MKAQGSRGPITDEELFGHADRVEVYQFTNTTDIGKVETAFSRFNSLRKLLETRKHRLGEYANLFGFFPS